MPDPMSFEQLMTEVARAQQMMEETFREAPDSKEKEILGKVLEGLTSARRDAEQAFPRAVEEVQKSMDRTAATVEKARKEHAEKQAQIKAAREKAQAAIQKQAEADAAAKAQQAAGVPPAPAATDLPIPNQAGPLGKELLGRLAAEEAATRKDASPHDIWEGWE